MGTVTLVGVGAPEEIGMGCEIEEIVLAVADITFGSLQTVLGEATRAILCVILYQVVCLFEDLIT